MCCSFLWKTIRYLVFFSRKTLIPVCLLASFCFLYLKATASSVSYAILILPDWNYTIFSPFVELTVIHSTKTLVLILRSMKGALA